MPDFRLFLLGPPRVEAADGQPVPGLGPGKPLALLAYLAVRCHATRDQLIDLLWGEVPEGRARNAFRQTLHRMRGALKLSAAPQSRDSNSIELEQPFPSDLSDFESALGAGRLAEAIALYRGEFLEGLDLGERSFDEWVRGERARINARYRSALQDAIKVALDEESNADAVSYASRLAESAPYDADAAVLAATTLVAGGRKAEAIAGLELYASRIQSEIGGSPAPMVSQLLARLRKSAPEAGRPMSAVRLPFLGREQEMATLLGVWRNAQKGAGETILVTGARGIGKTRLIEEFLGRAAELESALLLKGRERRGGAPIPHASVAEALRGALSAPGLAGASQHLLAEASRLLPELRDQFNLPAAGVASDEAERVRFFEGVAALLDAVAYEQPVCVVLEDLDLATDGTLDLVGYLTDRLGAVPILFVITARDETIRRRFTQKRHLSLGQIRADAARELALASFAAVAVAPALVEEIIEAADGIPIRVIELAKRVAGGEAVAGMPADLRDVLWSRLQAASSVEQRLFVSAALLNRPASLRLLAAAAHLSETAAFEAAMALQERGLIIQTDGGVSPASDQAASLAADETGPAGRALLAGWAAAAVAKELNPSDAELAHLYYLAGNRPLAFPRAVAAAHQALHAADESGGKYFLGIASACARGDAEREKVASLQELFGVGAPRIGSGGRVASPASPANPAAASSVSSESPTQETSGEELPPPNAGWIFGIPARHRHAVLIGAVAALGLAVVGSVRAVTARRQALRGRTMADTLMLADASGGRKTFWSATGDIVAAPHSLKPLSRLRDNPPWTDSLRLPWVNASPSPTGQFVAVERVSPKGSDLYLISTDKRDTIPLATDPGDDISAGWSPDGKWLLVIHGAAENGQEYHSHLFAYPVFPPRTPTPVDTASNRSVVDAAWSPDGLRIAWSARSGPEHQQDIYVSYSDGSAIRNLSNHPAEDYDPFWSPDGERVGFTSERDGNAELYSAEVETGRLYRLTFDPAHDDRAHFSPDGQFVAFESTRGGETGIYVMPSWGGTPQGVTPAGSRFNVLGWHGQALPYYDQLRIKGPEWLAEGDSALLTVTAFDQFGKQLPVRTVTWRLLTPSIAELKPDPTIGASSNLDRAFARITGRNSGLASVIASAGSWRSDTAVIRIGGAALVLAEDDFKEGLDAGKWRALGVPKPSIRSVPGSTPVSGLSPMADGQWESGILSRAAFPIRSGLSLAASVHAPFTQGQTSSTRAVLSLVATESAATIDSVAPQFLKLISVSWLGEAGRIAYAVDREVFTEPVSSLGRENQHVFRFVVGNDGRVSFFADDKLRWRSTLDITRNQKNTRAQIWLGGKGTGPSVVFREVRLFLTGGPVPAHQ